MPYVSCGCQFSQFICFLREQLSICHAKFFKKEEERVRVYTMSNSLLRETNSLRSISHALRLATIKYLSYNLSIGILFYCISMISGENQSPTPYLY
jgi:hypothetical protein